MTFGFPAYHTEIYSPSESGFDMRIAAKSAISAISWSIIKESADTIIASCSMSWRSCGEKIIITFLPNSSISVTSKCVSQTQCLDWGKNKANVKIFLNEFRNIHEEQPQTKSTESLSADKKKSDELVKIFMSVAVFIILLLIVKFTARQVGKEAAMKMNESISRDTPSKSDQFAQCFTDSVTINMVGAVTQYTSEIPGIGICNIFITHNIEPARTESAVHAALKGYLEGRVKMAGSDLEIIHKDIVQYGNYTAIEYEYSATQSGTPFFSKGLYFQHPSSTTVRGVSTDTGYNISTVCIGTAKDIACKKYNAIRDAFLKVKL